jgi:hypothetical protein
MDTASSISRRRPQTEVTPYLGHHQVEPNPDVVRDLWHERTGAAHATLRRLPHRVALAPPPPPAPSSAAGVELELERHAASATAISTLGRPLASAVMAEADAGGVDLVSSQQISAMAREGGPGSAPVPGVRTQGGRDAMPPQRRPPARARFLVAPQSTRVAVALGQTNRVRRLLDA